MLAKSAYLSLLAYLLTSREPLQMSPVIRIVHRYQFTACAVGLAALSLYCGNTLSKSRDLQRVHQNES